MGGWASGWEGGLVDGWMDEWMLIYSKVSEIFLIRLL